MSEYIAFDVPECDNCVSPRREQCQKLFNSAINRRRAMNSDFVHDIDAIVKANKANELLDLSEEIHELEIGTLLRLLDVLQCRLRPDAVIYRILIACEEPDI